MQYKNYFLKVLTVLVVIKIECIFILWRKIAPMKMIVSFLMACSSLFQKNIGTAEILIHLE